MRNRYRTWPAENIEPMSGRSTRRHPGLVAIGIRDGHARVPEKRKNGSRRRTRFGFRRAPAAVRAAALRIARAGATFRRKGAPGKTFEPARKYYTLATSPLSNVVTGNTRAA